MRFLRRHSIAFRLIAAVLTVEFCSSLLVILFSFGYERHAHFSSFSVMLQGRADSVLGAVQDAEDAADNVMLDQSDLHLPAEDVYAVWDENGRLLGHSPNWEGTEAKGVPEHNRGFLQVEIGQRKYGLLRMHGIRTVDPGEPGGGKLRTVTIYYGSPTEHVWHAIYGTVRYYAAGSLILLLVTGPLIAWLLHRGLLPLRQLAGLASQVSVNSWQFSPPASARETAELAPLTLAIEEVLARLERAFHQQRVFVSDAAHELKTAVAVIKSSLQVLGLKPRKDAEYKAGIERSLADTERLERLVAEMLELARVEAGSQGATANAISDMAESINRVAEQLSTFSALRGIRVLVEVPATATVPLTAEDSSTAISNLLLNALQHSPSGSEVSIRLRCESGKTELTVEDHGDGIDSELLPHVFDRFFRGDPSRSRATGGAGLGLAIVKAIVDRAGGSIHIESHPGQGTTVTVRLPDAMEAAVS